MGHVRSSCPHTHTHTHTRWASFVFVEGVGRGVRWWSYYQGVREELLLVVVMVGKSENQVFRLSPNFHQY